MRAHSTILEQIHKGLRVYMYETATELQRTDLSDFHSANTVVSQIEFLIECFEAHAYFRNTFMNSRSESTQSDLGEIKGEEFNIEHAGGLLTNRIAEWRGARDSKQRRSSGQRLQFIFNEFIAFKLIQLNRDEDESSKVSAYITSDSISCENLRTLFRTLPTPVLITTMKWMVRGISDRELTSWMVDVKNHAPTQLHAILISMAEHEIEPSRWSRIEKSMDAAEDRIRTFNVA